MQQGRWVARQIAADLAGNARTPFHYLDKGSLATIGRAAAVAQFGKIHISGFLAWLSWLFVHIFFLIGFRNRIIVMIEWAWSYFTYDRSARLITGESRRIAVSSMEYVEQARTTWERGCRDFRRGRKPGQSWPTKTQPKPASKESARSAAPASILTTC